jgi:hypothetical protein
MQVGVTVVVQAVKKYVPLTEMSRSGPSGSGSASKRPALPPSTHCVDQAGQRGDERGPRDQVAAAQTRRIGVVAIVHHWLLSILYGVSARSDLQIVCRRVVPPLHGVSCGDAAKRAC